MFFFRAQLRDKTLKRIPVLTVGTLIPLTILDLITFLCFSYSDLEVGHTDASEDPSVVTFCVSRDAVIRKGFERK